MIKQKAFRDKKYGKWIHENLNCCITGRPYPDPHHIIGHGYSAMGAKAPDHLQMALSHDLHLEIHQHGWKAFEEKYEVTQKELAAKTLAQSHAIGRINIFDLITDGHIPEWLEDEIIKLGALR